MNTSKPIAERKPHELLKKSVLVCRFGNAGRDRDFSPNKTSIQYRSYSAFRSSVAIRVARRVDQYNTSIARPCIFAVSTTRTGLSYTSVAWPRVCLFSSKGLCESGCVSLNSNITIIERSLKITTSVYLCTRSLCVYTRENPHYPAAKLA